MGETTPLYDIYIGILDESIQDFRRNSNYNMEIEFNTVIDFIRREIRKEYENISEKLKKSKNINNTINNRARRENIKNSISNYITSMLDGYFKNDYPLLKKEVIPFLRKNTAIVFMGNGISKEIHEIDIKEIAGQILNKNSITNKEWKEIKNNPEKDRDFKNRFISLCNDIDKKKIHNSSPHKIIVILFETGFLKHIATFNWDTFIEEVYSAVTGKEISRVIYGITKDSSIFKNKRYLWKMHGDMDFPDGEWVYPHEGGKLHPKFAEEIKTYPGIFLIVGYSEEEKFKEFLKQHLGTRQYVIRGRKPQEEGKEYYRKREIIHLTARAFFEVIKDYLYRYEQDFKQLQDKLS